jgi:predicted ATPase/tRNA A-37 threonylcarbamoyl transferase component Bud32
MMLTTFGHYRVDAQIGRGGMAEVFRAFDTRLNRPVAVKVMRGNGDEQLEQTVERFLREARAASALNHPNIVVIHEVGETAAGEHFIVQEFVDGRTVRSLLREVVPLDTTLDLAGQVARALAAAHAAGIVHRDVKPENIMVRSDGFVKVLDFGLARVTDADATMQTHLDTAPGALLGTPSYMAPEQASGRVSGPAADVFALGIVLYEMAAGRRPFVAPTHLGVLASIISEHPVPMSLVCPAVPRRLDDLVLRMLDKQPERRPSARDVERELAALRAGDTWGVVADGPEARRTTVGREIERSQLLRAYGRVKGGRALIVGVAGEPGVGKTSVVEDFFRDLASRSERPIVAPGRCSETLAGAEAYLPILEVLDRLLHPGSGPSFDGVIRAIAPSWYLQVATHSAEASAAGAVREASPAVSQERMKRELGALFQELSRQQPVVLFIDDLHWADVSTIDALNYLAARCADMRLLVLTSYRPSDMAIAKHPFLGIKSDLQAHGVFEEIALPFLEQADVERYLALQFPNHEFPVEFAAAVHAKTDGSPLFMADLVRYLRDTGGIAQTGGGWVLARSVPDVPRDLPESMRAMIARKIERLDEHDRRLLLAASIQGHEFDSASIGEAVDMDPGEVEDRLEVLERVHVFVKRGDELEFPDGTLTMKYRFVHVLYQNVLYASLQPTRRIALSRNVVRALAAHHGAETASIAGRLALLYETARDFASSASFFFLAAQRAVGLIAFREALSLADRGLAGLRSLPDGPDRQQRELGLQMVRGLALRNVKGWAAPELEATFARARQLCQQLNDPPELFPVLWNVTFFNMIRGDLPLVREQTIMLKAQAERASESAFLMSAHHIAGVAAEFTGDLGVSSRELERSRELHDPMRHREYTQMFGIDPGMFGRAMSSRPLWSLGFPDRALARGLETIAIARTQREPPTLVFALLVAQGVHVHRGEPWEALAFGAEAIAMCHEYEFPQEAEWALGFQASALVQLGYVGDGVEQLQSSLAALQALKSGLVRTMFLTMLADALRQAGRIGEGLAAIDEGFAHADRTSERGYVSELHRLQGELFLLDGDQARAEASMRAAASYARDQQARSFELRAATTLARLLASSGRPEEASAILAPVYGWFTEGHGTADLMAAQAILRELA